MKILITGTSSGIGQNLARSLGSAGHEIWGLARRPQEEFLAECRQTKISFRSSQCDVADSAQVTAALQHVQTAWSNLDALVCCAAIQAPIGPTMTIDPAAWTRNLAINLTGPLLCIQASHPLLLRTRHRAKVICFSGGGATSPRPNFTAYAVAKTALVRLVENLAHEWLDLPIDINAVAPGAVRTAMTDEVLRLGPAVVGEKEFRTASDHKEPSDAVLAPYARLTQFLLSSESDGISGRLISAPWDPWTTLPQHAAELSQTDIYTLRRITPPDRDKAW